MAISVSYLAKTARRSKVEFKGIVRISWYVMCTCVALECATIFNLFHFSSCLPQGVPLKKLFNLFHFSSWPSEEWYQEQ